MSALTHIKVERMRSPQAAGAMIGEMVNGDLVPSPIWPGTVVHDADSGEPILAYTKLVDPGPFRRAMLEVRSTCAEQQVARSKNYRSYSRTFGFSPRRPVMGREACHTTSLTRDFPHVAALLERYADQFSEWIAAVDPAIVLAGQAALSEVLPDWRMGDAKLWTSGVINDTAQLPYHRDGFNFPTWSAMPVVRRGTRGGHLHLPEYNLVIPCGDATVTYFEGHRLVHGVTPITRLHRASDDYRVSVVYYALRGMKNCREYAEETVYGRTARTQREQEMAARLKTGDTAIPNKGVGALDRMHGTLAAGGFDATAAPRR